MAPRLQLARFAGEGAGVDVGFLSETSAPAADVVGAFVCALQLELRDNRSWRPKVL